MRGTCKILPWYCSYSCEQAENRDETRLVIRGNGSRVDFCKGFARRVVLCCSLIAFYSSFAERITFENGLDGWTTSGDISWSANSSYTGSKTAKAAVSQKTGGKKGLLKSSAALAPECDNITVSLEVYNEFVASSKNHQLQVVATTNNWKGSFLVGGPIYVYNELATNETGEVLQWWKTEPQVAFVPGASQDIPLCIGLQAIAASGSGKDIYVREVDVEYKASATPSHVRFCDATGSEALPVPGDAPFLAVDVRALPPEDVHVSKVVISSLRDDDVELYGATNIPGTSVWISSNQVAKVYDAGEGIFLSARVEYSSDHFETLGKDGVEETAEKDRLPYVVPRRGSVWINEVGRKENGAWFIEIAGATNRYLTRGWTVEVVGAGEHNVLFTDAFDFGTFTNGVGFQVFDWANPPRDGSYTLKLLNSSRICESSATVDFTLAEGESLGKIGYLPFVENWDYQDAETKLDWTAHAVSSTPEAVNDQEGFNVSISGEIEVYAYRLDGGMEKAVPSALVTVTNSFTGEGNKKETLNTDAGGAAVFEFIGTHCNATFLPVGVEAKAFGWSSLPTNGQWNSGNRVKMKLDSSVGFEPFDDDLWKSYMEFSGDIRWNHSTVYGSASADVSQKGSGKQAIASTRVPFFTRGKRIAQYQMRVKNVSGGTKKDKAWAEVSANGSVWWTTPSVFNNYEGQTSDVWNSLLTYTEIPGAVTASDDLTFSLVGEAFFNSGKMLYVDDIRLAFQDSVEISELAVATNVVKEGQTAAAFSAVITPLATEAGVKSVSVDFMLKVKDGEKVMGFAVPCDWSNAVTVDGGVAYEGSGPTNTLVKAMRFTATTNDVSAALAAAGGGQYFGTGATIEYYVCAHYYADSNDPDKEKEWEERYYPDNHQVDEKGVWYVIGDYNPVATNMTITGPGLSFRSDPVVRSDGFSFDFRAFSAAGDIVSNGVSVAGVTTNFVAGGRTAVLDSSFTWDSSVRPLEANTDYTVRLLYWRENGEEVWSEKTITTLGTAAAPTLEGRSADSLTVKAEGCKAAAMKIACNGSEKWIAHDGSATFTGLKPDCDYDVTVVAVRNRVGVESETSATTTFSTLPNAPMDKVRETPGWDSHTISVADLLNEDFGAFGNPSNTVYAFYVENVDKAGTPVATNWLGEANGGLEELDTAEPKWLTLAEWDQKTFRLSRTTTETNNLYLVAGGRPPLPTSLEAVNGFEPTAANKDGTLIKITLVAETAGEAERVAYDPAQHDKTYGFVTFTSRVMSPFAAGVGDVQVDYEFSTDDGANWNPMTLSAVASEMEGGATPTISGKALQGILSDTCPSNIVTVTWNAAKDLTFGSVYGVQIRATIQDGGAHTAVTAEVPLKGGKMDFEPPVPSITLNKPELVNGGYTSDPGLNATLGNAVAFKWKMAGDWSAETTATVIQQTGLGDGAHSLAVIGRDEWGNWTPVASAATKSWTVDTKKPEKFVLSGDPEAGATTLTNFDFTASAEDATKLTYHWTLNDVDWEGTSSNYVGTVLEGTNWVSVFARDAADNVCDPATRTWIVDRTPPEILEWTGKPAADKQVKITKETGFSMSAKVQDNLTQVKVHWKLDDEAEAEGEKFVREKLSDGAHTVWLYATDEASNSTATNSWTWSVDTTAPDNLKIVGTPAETPFVTTVTEVNLTASATDNETPEEKIAYTWTFNGLKSSTTALLDTTAQEGTNTAKVVATDEAGNSSEVTRTWVVDTHCPTNLVIKGWPGNEETHAYTNEAVFAYTATAMDDTRLTFHWKFDAGEEVKKNAGDAFTEKDLKDGTDFAEVEHTVSVYVTDEAQNVSVTNSVSWAYDVTPPKVVVLSGEKTPDPFGKGTEFLEVEVTFSEPVVGFCKDSVSVDNGAQVESFEQTGKKDDTSYLVKIRPGDDGLITVKIVGEKVKDRAGNWNVASEPLTHTYDTTPPENFTFEATPKNTEVVATSNFNFKVSATDTTTVTYYWKTNEADYVSLGAEKKDGVWEAEFEGLVSEGTNTLSVYGTDKLGNPTVTNSIWWVVDMTPPELPEIIGDKPKKITKETGFDLTAKATDTWTAITYHWMLKCGENIKDTGAEPTFAKSDLADGDYTVFVYAEDEAHNVSETNSWAWTVDTVSPTVTLSSKTPKTFNEYKVPLIVDVTFSEDVEGFTTNCVALENGVVTNLTGSGKSYTLFIDPRDEDDDEAFVMVSVNIGENQVTDPAGNGNEAAKEGLAFKNVTKMPTVTFASTTPDPFNEGSLVVTATFVRGKTLEAAVVTNFTTDVIAFTNCTVEKVEVSPTFPTNVYTITVTPKVDGKISLMIPAGVVADEVGNPNEPSDLFTCTYDATAPAELAIFGTPTEGKVTASQDFGFWALAEDLTALKYYWKLTSPNGADVVVDHESSSFSNKVLSIQAEKGTNTVSVYAVDAASNRCAAVSRTWIVDYEPPVWEDVAIYGEPGIAEVIVVTTNANFSYTAQATDAVTRITYHWWTNVAEVAVNPTNLVGVAIEGTNTVMVFAADEADNISTTNKIVWVVDRIAPTNLVMISKPAKLTRETEFAMTAQADDKTVLTYFWKLDKQETATELKAGEEFIGKGLADGEHTVTVYAKDEAQNVSATESWTWTVDTTAPVGLAIGGKPTGEPFVISDPTVELEASATDVVTPAEKIVYTWKFNEGEEVESPTLTTTALEGTNTVSVWARDELSNTCEKVTRTWVVDTLDPSNLQFVAEFPGRDVVTNGAAFAFTVRADDATQLKYHWLTNGTEVADHYDPSFGGTAFEGTNTVSVYAEDEAHNVSLTNDISWVYDFKAPSMPEIVEGAPMGGATNNPAFAFTAQSKDDWSNITYHWSLTDGKTATGQTFADEIKGDDGTYTMSVWAEDEAHNVSGTNTWSWTLDRVEPVMPTITGTPASNSYVNVALFNLYARLEKDDATAVSFHWTLDEDKTETVASNFTKSVTTEGLHTAYVYAKDAAGNVSPTNSISWTYDITAPKLFPISGTLENGSATNKPNYDLTVVAEDASKVEFNWWIIGEGETPQPGTPTRDGSVSAAQKGGYSGSVDVEGTYTVFVYAKDAAGNVSQTTNSLSWTYDATPPQGLEIGGTPSTNRFVVATDDFDFRASYEYDLTDVSYRWTLNGAPGSTTAAFDGRVSDGTNTVTVYAIDQACNTSAVSRTWVADTLPPTNRIVFAMPGDGALTNTTFFSITALAEDATTQVEYCWTTNDIAVLDKSVTTNLTSWLAREGTNTVTVYAKDEAGNVSETNTVRWMVDLTPPTVELSTKLSADKVINLADVTTNVLVGFNVLVDFSEPVTGFTLETVKVTNGNGTVTAVETNDASHYVAWVMPARDGEITLKVEANEVKDLAGNDNVASEMSRTCDLTLPTVTITGDQEPFAHYDAQTFTVTVTFSEPVSDFTAKSVSVENCQVKTVTGESMVYTVVLSPTEGTNGVWIAEGAVSDKAGNPTESSNVFKRVYDNSKPTEPVLSGTPENGSETTSRAFSIMATSSDLTQLTYDWRVDGGEIIRIVGTGTLSGVVGLGEHTVELVHIWDDVGYVWSGVKTWKWTVVQSPNVDFGGGVFLAIDPTTQETNGVSFTAVDFHPGADSTVTMSGFGVEPEKADITGLKMWLMVSETVDGEPWPVPVDAAASFDTDTKELTVTIPGKAMLKTEDPAEPYSSLFFFGVDNEDGGK